MSGFAWTDAAVRTALGLRPELAVTGHAYTGVSTDSRTLEPGALYVALVGDRFDGHDFVADALARGAGGAVVSRTVEGEGEAILYPVEDTLVALGALAAHRREALEVPVVAITGSSGKTTTKELTAAALGETLRVHATRGNLNNRVGMPLTLLGTPDDAEVVVLELGTNEPGEIAALTAIARPDVGVLTTVGESHLEKLRSLEGVIEEKLDLLRGVVEGGTCIVGDEPSELVARAREACPGVRVVGWGEEAEPEDRPTDVSVDVWGVHEFAWRGRAVRLALAGRHAVSNALLALAVADALGVPTRAAVRGIAGVQPGGMRGEVRRIGDLTVLVDCYNANPQSVRAAIDVLEAHAASRRVAVLGTMLELGEASERLHAEVLADVLAHDIDLVVATGGFGQAAEEASDPRLLPAPGWREAWPELRARLEGREVVLLKASRGVAMEGLLDLIEEDFGAPAAANAGEEG